MHLKKKSVCKSRTVLKTFCKTIKYTGVYIDNVLIDETSQIIYEAFV